MRNRIRSVFMVALLLTFVSVGESYSFDVIKKENSFLGAHYLTLGLGLGASNIAGYETVSSGGPNFAFEIDLGHEYSQSFALDFSYKFSLVGLRSPNPVDLSQTVDSTFIFNSEALRLFYKFSTFNFQPYAYFGIGMYNFNSVDSKTGMNFPLDLQIPVGAGFWLYVLKDKLSFRAGLDWHILFGENQRTEVLNLLNVDKVSFDVYSIMVTCTWHIF